MYSMVGPGWMAGNPTTVRYGEEGQGQAGQGEPEETSRGQEEKSPR